MDDATSIGELLRSKRESRGLGVNEAHEATKITPQYLSALEENRFDVFPNKVYARAFLRDYANFLDLDSASLLARYEDEWGGPREVVPAPRPPRSAWRGMGYALVVIVLLGGAGVGAYYWWTGHERQVPVPLMDRDHEPPPGREERIPPPQPPPGVESEPGPRIDEPEPAPPPEPVAPPTPVQLETITLDVTALREVWVRVRCDGKNVYEAIMPKGTSKVFDAKETIEIRAGMAGAVQLKFNGVPEPSLGTLQRPGQKTFRRGELPSTMQ